MAHEWARWLPNPYLHGVPTASQRGAKSQVAQKWARWLHNPRRLGGPPPLHSGGQNHRWPTSGQGGYTNPATGGGAHRFKAWPKSEVAYKWARWLHNPCRLGCPPLHSGGQNLRWSTSGQGGYITPTALWVPTASQRGAESKVAHKWARWLYSPYCLGGPHRFTAGGTIRGGPQVGNMAT